MSRLFIRPVAAIVYRIFLFFLLADFFLARVVLNIRPFLHFLASVYTSVPRRRVFRCCLPLASRSVLPFGVDEWSVWSEVSARMRASGVVGVPWCR